MKKLIICNTYYQLILAVQMKLSLFNNDDVDIQISDDSINACNVAKRLEEINLFRTVRFYPRKDFFKSFSNRSFIRKVYDVLVYTYDKNSREEISIYDEIIFFNFDRDYYLIENYYKKIKRNVTWSRMEEGLLTYADPIVFSRGDKITNILRKISNKSIIVNKINRFYCTEPELARENTNYKNLIQIPKINQNDIRLIEILNYIFDYKYEKIKQKYIFFSSSSDIDGVSFGETELILKVADAVGSDNIIVKMHPRDTRKVYQDYGIKVMEKSSIPWEVVQLNMLKDDHILLTATSGAFLNISSMVDEDIIGYFLFECIENKTEYLKEYSENICNILNKLKRMNKCNKIDVYQRNS